MKTIIKRRDNRWLSFVLAWLFIACLATASVAQTPGHNPAEDYGPVGVDGSVIISGLQLSQVGDSLVLVFEVDVNRRAINNRQTWRIVPELSLHIEEHSLQMPTMLITGRQKSRHFNRKERFSNRWLMANYPEIKTEIPRGTDTTLIYSVALPYEMWMDHAHLHIHQYLASPKEKRQLFSSDGYGMVALQPIEPYCVDPRVVYITPEREVKRRSAGFYSLVDFPVGVSRIIPDFRRNPEELHRIDQELTLINSNPHIEVEAIFMEGHASPEGSVALNDRLSRERVEALKRYFVEKHKIKPEMIRTANVTEDWMGMRAIVDSWEESAGKERVLAIVDSDAGSDIKEQQLRALPQWGRLIREVFPRVRRTEYRIDYIVRDFSVEESRSVILQYPELFSHYELFMLAMSHDEKSDQRVEILEMILMKYHDDDVALNNYVAALIMRGELPTARRNLEKISDATLAANNRGVEFMLSGEYDRAQECFEASPDMESLHNLLELEKKVENEIKMERYSNRKRPYQ